MLEMILQTHVRIYQVETRSLIGWLVLGLIAGWLAGKISRGRGFGCITDIILGLVGGVLGGWLFTKLGMVGYSNNFIYSLAAATVGAVIIVAIAHLFSSGS
ncbi:MAG TPA: GlsB/YeaQ/YmgE family stress response membrane protein [Candidatus Acidoferrum sp.]|nr:GlsB/YeaQ/YmgE family stress response membrane protein [Candidatus Acidoferrum sp.]